MVDVMRVLARDWDQHCELVDGRCNAVRNLCGCGFSWAEGGRKGANWSAAMEAIRIVDYVA
eukprot:1250605-Pyramimonas_sp.AAC.1